MDGAVERSGVAAMLARGVCRALDARGFGTLTEFTLRSGRRADVVGLAADGTIVIVEIKSSLEDFRTDRKWTEYRDYCDEFYFAVAEAFPREILPPDAGLMIADGFDAAILRPAPRMSLHASRRKVVTISFGRTASMRLLRAADGGPGIKLGTV